jgi:hypothetical protein
MNSSGAGSVNNSLNWTEATTADTHTAGVGGSWKVTDNFKLGADYTFSYALNGFNQNGPAAAFQAGSVPGDQLPNVTSMLNSLSLHGEYEYQPGVTLYVGYGFDRLDMSDWSAWGGNFVGTAATSGAFLSGQNDPHYNIHTILTKVSFKW